MKICKNCNIEYESGKFCKKCGSPLVDKDEQALVCANCGNKLEPGVKFCPECGTKVAPQKLVCSGCGMELKPGVKFCPECGTKVGEARKEDTPKVDEDRGKQLFLQAYDCEDDDEEFRLYLESTKYGYAPAFCELAYCYEYGTGCEVDKQRAEELECEAFSRLSEAVSSNDPIVLYYYGACYYWGDGVDVDFEKAFYYIERSALLGYSQAQDILGDMYYEGEGTQQNKSKAVFWYEKAANQGEDGALNSLGDCYYNGEGVSKDYAYAVMCYRKAAEQENENAQYNLGRCYKDGIGVASDYKEAKRWLKLAAENGSDEAAQLLSSF